MKDFESNRTQIMNSIENRVRQAYNSGYDMGFRDGEIAGYDKTDIWQDGYHKGLEEAWECAKSLIRTYHSFELRQIFDYDDADVVLAHFTAYEAIEKIRAYESKLNEPDKEYEIQIGDEVMSIYGDKGYVTGIEGDEFCVLYPNGTVGHSSKSTYAFTGKSNPLIKDILEQMKGAAE